MPTFPWTEVSVGVAAVMALVYNAITARKSIKDTSLANAKVLETMLEFVGAHMSRNTQAQEASAKAMERVATRLELLERTVIIKSGDNTSTVVHGKSDPVVGGRDESTR